MTTEKSFVISAPEVDGDAAVRLAEVVEPEGNVIHLFFFVNGDKIS
jgi:hypothetical protein